MRQHISDSQEQQNRSNAGNIFSKEENGQAHSSGNPLQKMADDSSQVKQLRAYQQMADRHSASRSQVVQRQLTIAGQVAANLNGVAGLPADQAVTDILEGWIGAGAHVFADWPTAIARAFLHRHGYVAADIIIEDPALTAGNCHGYTFGNGGDDAIDFDSPKQAFVRYDAGRPLLICVNNGRIEHSAWINGGRYWQTLPGGPVFSTTRAQIEAHYPECYDLSNMIELVAFVELGDAVEKQQIFEADLNKTAGHIDQSAGKNDDYYEVTAMHYSDASRKRLNELIDQYNVPGTG